MVRRISLVCDICCGEIDPAIYEDCEKAFIVGRETYCKNCFKDWLRDWIETSTEDVAEAIGVAVVDTEREEEE